jgi:hypothetical protein
MVVALLALFFALAGGAYGVVRIASRNIVNNTVRTQDLRNNEIRGKDVRNRTLGRRDVAFDSLTGNQIDEPSLERVPRAADAQALQGKRRTNVAPFTLTAGQAREVLREGPFVLTARCRIGLSTATGPIDLAEVLISTDANNAAFDAADSGDLDTNTPEDARTFVDVTSDPPGDVAIDSLQEGLAVAPDGTEEIADANLYAMVNALGQPGTCRFGGYVDLG